MPGRQDLIASISAGREWLERHSDEVLPDTLAFAHIGIRAVGLSIPERLRAPRAGKVAKAVIPLSPAFKVVAAATGPLYRRYRGRDPFANVRGSLASRGTPGRPYSDRMTTIDRAAINCALAEAVRGRLSRASLGWMRQRHTTGFVLTHQLLAWLFCVWNDCRHDAAEFARRAARKVFWETAGVVGYYDLLAQQTALLGLGGWPTADLEPLVRHILRSQDTSDGGWHYFDRRLSRASETLARICYDQSPLLGWPIPYREEKLGALANVVHQAHRAHATGLSICAAGVFCRATTLGAGAAGIKAGGNQDSIA